LPLLHEGAGARPNPGGSGATRPGYAERLSVTRLSLLVDLTAALAREIDLDQWLGDAATQLAEGLDAERATVWLVDGEHAALVTRVAVLPEVSALRQPLDRGIAGWVAARGQVLRIDDASTDPRFDPSADRLTGFVTRSVLAAPIRVEVGAPVRGVVQVLNKKEGRWDAEDERYLATLGRELGKALALTTLAPIGDQPGLVLRGPFNRIVGRSPAMEAVYERIGLAAEADVTVLFRGETGTGKTLLARAIHVNSARAASPFVTVDCTTLPAALIESELFGHERGAFTGAERRVKGRLELAEGGTLFLDEIGDLPLDLQGKLLRFLQDRSFSRVGGRETLSAELRVVAATHVDLEAAVREKRFREDLYYRLRVLEIEVPSLRARGPDEIERLALHFLERFGKRYGREGARFADDALAVLRAHRFPGNVRELEHWVESAVVLSPDGLVTRERLPRPRLLGDVETPQALSVAVPRGSSCRCTTSWCSKCLTPKWR
jgi:transcriptional regulator with GAF, ATPase, and Fis domain